MRFRALGTEVLIYAPVASGLEGGLQTLVEGYEARFSRFRAGSELRAVEDANGQGGPVSADLFELLSLARGFWQETGGLFDPLILPELEAAGYDRTFDAVPRFRKDAPAPGRSVRPNFGSVVLDEHNRQVRLPPGARLDLGGIAKGWIIERLNDALSQFGRHLIDIGGDMTARGAGPDGNSGWLIAIADPFQPESDAVWLRLCGEAIATSTTMRRRWNRGGRWLHHIIDPRTGCPADSDLAQVSVVAPTAVAADIYAKTALILGKEAGLDWLNQRSAPALLVTERDELVRSIGWERLETPQMVL